MVNWCILRYLERSQGDRTETDRGQRQHGIKRTQMGMLATNIMRYNPQKRGRMDVNIRWPSGFDVVWLHYIIDFYIQLLRGVDQYFEVLKPLARPDMVLPGRLRRLLWKICHAQTPRTSLASKSRLVSLDPCADWKQCICRMIDVLRMYACPCIYVCVCPHIHSTHILDIRSLRMYMCMHRFRSTICIYLSPSIWLDTKWARFFRAVSIWECRHRKWFVENNRWHTNKSSQGLFI
jgi:hypothetical protein